METSCVLCSKKISDQTEFQYLPLELEINGLIIGYAEVGLQLCSNCYEKNAWRFSRARGLIRINKG